MNGVLTTLEDEGLGQNNKFLSGKDDPNLGDLAVFGVLRSIEGLPTHAEAVDNRGNGRIREWYNRLKELAS